MLISKTQRRTLSYYRSEERREGGKEKERREEERQTRNRRVYSQTVPLRYDSFNLNSANSNFRMS